MSKLYNLARMTTATTGAGTITLGSAVNGYVSFAAAGAADGETVSYGIADGANSEVGYGVYTASGTTLTRNVVTSTNSNAAIGLSGAAQVFITANNRDIGKWANRRIAKTAAYSVVNADAGSTIALGGSAFYALTFSAASGYDSDFTVMVLNEDTTRAKWVIVPGYAQGGLYLWPGQNVLVFVQNGVWYVNGKTRWKVPGTTFNLFTDYSQTSNDTVGASDGLVSGTGAFRSVQRALDILADEFDFSALSSAQTLAVVNMAASTTDTRGVHFSGRAFVGAQGGAAVKIQGGGASVMSPTSTDAFGFFCNTIVQIRAVAIQTTTGGFGVVADLGAQVYLLDQVQFNACANGHMTTNNDGKIYLNNNYAVVGSAPSHFLSQGGGKIVTQATIVCTFGASVTMVTGWAIAGQGGYIIAPNWSFNLNSFTVTGYSYSVNNLSLIYTGTGNPNYFPGSQATPAPPSGGGQYI